VRFLPGLGNWPLRIWGAFLNTALGRLPGHGGWLSIPR
jgi:hypothetical protein